VTPIVLGVLSAPRGGVLVQRLQISDARREAVEECAEYLRAESVVGLRGRAECGPADRKRCASPRSSAASSPDARLAAWRLSVQGRSRVPLPRRSSDGVSGLAHGERAG